MTKKNHTMPIIKGTMLEPIDAGATTLKRMTIPASKMIGIHFVMFVFIVSSLS